MILYTFGSITQTAPDTFTEAAIPTRLTVDGKTGWRLVELSVFFENGNTLSLVVDCSATLILSTESGLQSFIDPDYVVSTDWAINGTALSTSSVMVDRHRAVSCERVTVQPFVYLQCDSSSTGVACVMSYRLAYELVKLTDLEVMRLLQGGA
jgi:hypothetical protein